MNNEKIMQLAHQVGFNGTLTHTQAGTKHDTALADFDELIVRECMAQCRLTEESDRIRSHFLE